MFNRLLIVGLPLMGALSALPAMAAEPHGIASVLTQPNLSLTLANELAAGTLDACTAIGKTAVVDRGGNLIVLQRGDNIGPHNTLVAQRKAYTALSTKIRTGLLAERARNGDASQNLNTVGELLLLGGSVPVIVNGDVIGAVGVGGAWRIDK